MPARPHPVFTPPADINAKLWRYMDFTKFVSMLENRGLYFARCDRLGDPFEASLPKADNALRHDYDLVHSDGEYQRRNFRAIRKWTTVSCWHMNAHESAAMWQLYTKSNEAIAVCTTYQRLVECLDTFDSVGAVNYIDYDVDTLPKSPASVLTPFVHKRMSFQHESEVRAVIYRNPPLVPVVGSKPKWYPGVMRDDAGVEVMYDFDAEPKFHGIWRRVDLSVLLDEVRIAPGSPQWFKELVDQVVLRYGLGKPVVQSKLNDTPFY